LIFLVPSDIMSAIRQTYLSHTIPPDANPSPLEPLERLGTNVEEGDEDLVLALADGGSSDAGGERVWTGRRVDGD
jgi:hypothetical protein